MRVTTRQRDAALIGDIFPLTIADYEYLRYSNDRSVHDAFLEGDIEEPNLKYRDIELAHVDERLEEVAALRAVTEVCEDDLVRRAYMSKLDEIQWKYALLRAALAGDDGGVHDASVELYGAPRIDLFHYSQRVCKETVERVAALHDRYPQVRAALRTFLPAVSGAPVHPYPFESIVLPQARSFSGPPLSSQEVCVRCREAFRRYGVVGWQVVVDAPHERLTFNTNHALRTVFVPNDEDLALRKLPLTSERVDAIIAHEIGAHVIRRVRGEESPLALLGVGLAGYLRGEEGVATYFEQVQSGASRFAGGTGYLAVGWAMGLDGEPRTFRGLYELLVPYFLISALEGMGDRESIDIDALLEKAQRRAWARSVRTFRGTTGSSPGACYTKDVVYREGNIAIWERVTEDPACVPTFLYGKYDPTSVAHRTLLHELGMDV